jgi:SHS2 domain-containing protein
MNTPGTGGFREIEHTADWELQIWAPDLPGLLEQAALGMNALTGLRLQPTPRQNRKFKLEASDPERLLVSFLSELLWFGTQEGLGFDVFDLSIQENALLAQVAGALIASQSKEIKAVTYHHLVIHSREESLEVNIVFDV